MQKFTMFKFICGILIFLCVMQINSAKSENKGNNTKAQQGYLKLTSFSLKNGKANVTEQAFKGNGTSLTNATKGTAANATNIKAVKVSANNAKVAGSKQTEGSTDNGNEEGGKNEEYNDENSDHDSPNDYNYHDEYYGGESQGYEFNDNNGEQTGQGYNFNYNGGTDEQPMMQGQAFDFKGFPQQGNIQGFPGPSGGFPSQPNGGFPSQPNGGVPFPSYMGQGFVSYDDGTTDEGKVGQFGDNYEKKYISHNGKGKKIGMKKLNEVRHKHNSEKAKKLVNTKQHPVDGNAYRRTIMIGNRVCGSKRSTNVHAMKRDELRMRHDDGDFSTKKDAKGHDESPAVLHATDNCCAEHYDCPRIVPAKAQKYGYQNEIEYDVMSCNCDAKFRNCLKNANSYTADAVGHLYFNTLKIPCLTFEPEVAETKSEQPSPSQESMNVVSVVPDAETDRETVGGAQLVVAPRIMSSHNAKESQHEQQQQEHELHDQQQELQNQHPEQHYANKNKESDGQREIRVKDIKDDDEDDMAEQGNKNLKKPKRPDSIVNPNPSPAPGKIRGVVTVPEAYYPKITMQH